MFLQATRNKQNLFLFASWKPLPKREGSGARIRNPVYGYDVTDPEHWFSTWRSKQWSSRPRRPPRRWSSWWGTSARTPPPGCRRSTARSRARWTRTLQPIGRARYRQCWGSVTFWCGSGPPDPYLSLMDPDPVSDPNPTPDPTLRMFKKLFFSPYFFLITYPQVHHLQS